MSQNHISQQITATRVSELSTRQLETRKSHSVSYKYVKHPKIAMKNKTEERHVGM